MGQNVFRLAGAINNDASANGLTVSALTTAGNVLLATLAQNFPRKGYLIQNQSVADVYAVLDDSGGSVAPTVLVVAAGAGADKQGSTYDMTGLPHIGRIRIYGASGAQVALADW